MSSLRFGAIAAAAALGMLSIQASAQRTEDPATSQGQSQQKAEADQGDVGKDTRKAQDPVQNRSGSTANGSDNRAKLPLAGANSFTEGQARDRITKAGYANVRDLKKDDNGVWRGQAEKNGQRVAVALDFRGNVVQQ